MESLAAVEAVPEASNLAFAEDKREGFEETPAEFVDAAVFESARVPALPEHYIAGSEQLPADCGERYKAATQVGWIVATLLPYCLHCESAQSRFAAEFRSEHCYSVHCQRVDPGRGESAARWPDGSCFRFHALNCQL